MRKWILEIYSHPFIFQSILCLSI